MFRNLTPVQKATTFYLLSFGMACGVAVSVPESSDGGPLLTMFTPLLAVLLMLLLVTGDGYTKSGWAGLGLHRSGVASWPVAILVPAAIIAASYLVAAALGLTELSGPGWPEPVRLAVGIAVSLLFGLAEEIGWRGYLLPLLARRHARTGMAVVGFLHGVWHLPLMIATTSYHPLGNRLVTIPVMLGVVTLGGIFYGYLRLASSSVWPVVIAHQTFNSVSEWFDGIAVTERPTAMAYTVGETGLVTLALVAPVALWLLRRDPRTSPQTSTQKESTCPRSRTASR